MANGFRDYVNPTYDEIKIACKHIAEFIHYNASAIGKVDCIVGVTRGGLMPAQELSHMMNIPMETVNYSSKEGAGDNKNHRNSLPELRGKSILIVDDICDSGKTLQELQEAYTERGYTVFTAAIYYKNLKNDDEYVPDVWALKISKNFGFINFPWENSK
jgi:hypoxanthine phosphoribosyltransferase